MQIWKKKISTTLTFIVEYNLQKQRIQCFRWLL